MKLNFKRASIMSFYKKYCHATIMLYLYVCIVKRSKADQWNAIKR